MIAKRIEIRPQNDKYGQLGKYIADANHAGEKLLVAWHAGCLSETYETALLEIQATQAMNTRCKGEKTYHLVVSFRPEDEAKLTPEAFQDIEKIMAEALGLGEHQRLCGVHQNTNNLHLHIAYNMIDPERFTKKEPYRDFYKLSEACRALEAKYGLIADNGISKDRKEAQIGQRAASMEAQSGEQSFQSYALERKETILNALEQSTSWREFHAVLAEQGMVIKPHGNGLAVMNIKGKGAIKASTLFRSLSKKSLEDRYGAYITPTEGTTSSQYHRKPLQPKTPAREKLHAEYQKLLQKRQTRLDAARTHNNMRLQSIKDRYHGEYQTLTMRILPRTTKTRLRQILKVKEQQAVEAIRAAGQARLKEIRAAYPFHNWNGYLKNQAEKGNEAALAVLRSRKPQGEPVEGTNQEVYYEARRGVKRSALEQELRIATSSLGRKQRTGLLAVSRMEQLAAQEILQRAAGMGDQALLFSGVQHTIDNNGIVLFKLINGGTIRDTGKKVHFSYDKATRKAALIYGQLRFGKGIELIGNTIKRKPYGKQDRHGAGDHKPRLAVIQQICRNGLCMLSELNVVRFGKRAKMLLSSHACPDLDR
jgi:hypothetical protein